MFPPVSPLQRDCQPRYGFVPMTLMLITSQIPDSSHLLLELLFIYKLQPSRVEVITLITVLLYSSGSHTALSSSEEARVRPTQCFTTVQISTIMRRISRSTGEISHQITSSIHYFKSFNIQQSSFNERPKLANSIQIMT